MHAHIQRHSVLLTFSPSHTHTHTQMHRCPSVTFVLSRNCIYSLVERYFTAPLSLPLNTHTHKHTHSYAHTHAHTHTHLGLIGRQHESQGQKERPVEVRTEFSVERRVSIKRGQLESCCWSFTRPLLLPVGHRGNLPLPCTQSCHLCVHSVRVGRVSLSVYALMFRMFMCIPSQMPSYSKPVALCFKGTPETETEFI